MLRGTFANVRIKNTMVSPVEGGFTKHQPDGEEMSIYDAAVKYQSENTPTVISAGRNTAREVRAIGRRKDAIDGVKALSRSLLNGFTARISSDGRVPLQFKKRSAQSLKLDGTETFDLIVSKPVKSDRFKMSQCVSIALTAAYRKYDFDIEIDTPNRTRILQAAALCSMFCAAFGSC
jgi:aconitate hydratase